MEKRLFVNPAINDSAEFLKTSVETKGAYTLHGDRPWKK